MTEFSADGVTYVYDPSLITIEMAVIAEEIVSFKAQQQQRTDVTLEKVRQSGGMDWFPKCAAALLFKKTGDTVEAVSNALTRDGAEQFVRKLPFVEHKRLSKCMEDFFCSIGKGEMLSIAHGSATTQQANLANLLSLMKQLSGKENARK